MSADPSAPLIIHGWTIYAHPLFLAQVEALARQVESFKQKDPAGYVRKNASKRLAAILKLAFDVIPHDPTRPEYRQGGTLGEDRQHWFRAKFFQQYRLFFSLPRIEPGDRVRVGQRRRQPARLPERGRCLPSVSQDAGKGHPPDDWNRLLAEARAEAQRLRRWVEAGE